ncbi:MAG TPA: hypothetical protein DDY49_14955 [Paenibacillaceae bacterium]|nr:hypothetical protein [Paenibacillaceae bacterium]
MNEFSLWKKRFAHYTKLRIIDLKTVVDDWMVWAYILIPSLVIGLFLYRDTLLNPPNWFSAVPPTVLLSLFILRGWLSSYRVYLSPADPLFLQAGPWNERRFVFYSLGWQGIKEGIYSLILVFLLYPYLESQLGYGVLETLFLALLTWMVQMCLLNINWLFNQWGKWVYYSYKILSFLLIVPLISLLAFIKVEDWLSLSFFLGTGVAMLLSYVFIGLQKKWDWPWLIQDAAKRSQPFALSMTMEPEELKKRKYTKLSFLPFMQKSWNNHVDLISVSREISVKMFFRRSSQWRYALMMLSGGIASLIQINIFSVKVLVFTGILFLFFQLVSLSQSEMERRMWHQISPVDLKEWRKGKKKGIFLLMLLFGGILFLVMMISTFFYF